MTKKQQPELLALRRQVAGSPPSSSPTDAHRPTYLSVAAQEQPFLLQQADEVVTQGRLEGSNQNEADSDTEGSCFASGITTSTF